VLRTILTPRSSDLRGRATHIRLLHSRLARGTTSALQERVELVHCWWDKGLEDDDITVADDDELRAFLEPEALADLLGDDDLTLRGELGGGESSHGLARYLPYAFTEQGVAMLSSVLGSERAVWVNIEIMRAFVRLRQAMTTRADLVRRFDELEQRYDGQFKVVFDALRQLMAQPERGNRRIGFTLAEP
jgi:hypothetical protein